MASVDALSDLPMAWLHRLSTSLTAESAARLRTTCKLLQQVVDATWEPVEVEVPPHRRSVPLTFEQVQAQLPPPEPQPDDEDQWDEDEFWYDRYERPEQDGCNPYWQEVFGPALTRLTANQAVNLLKGKSVLSFLWCGFSDVDKHTPVTRKLDLGVRSQLLIQPDAVWPPANHSPAIFAASKGASDGAGRDVAGSRSETQSKPGSESESDVFRSPVRGECGWDLNWGEGVFLAECSTPAALVEKWSKNVLRSTSKPYNICVTTEYSHLLATTNSSCRQATPEEVEQFMASDSPGDGDRFDVYLSTDCNSGPMDVYVFLSPVEPRFTGRPKPGMGCCVA